MITHHWGPNATSPCGRAVSSAYSEDGHGYTSGWDTVDCAVCLAAKPCAPIKRAETPLTLGEYWSAGKGVGGSTPLTDSERQRRAWTIQVVGGETNLSLADWRYLHGHSNEAPDRHVPPRMEDERGLVDGVFTFTDVHLGEGYTLEVVPQQSGNVEITVAGPEDGIPEDGRLFTLSHLDRANLLRALLYDFHYSPERGGPNDDA